MEKAKLNKTLVVSFVSLMVIGLAGYAVFADSAKEKTTVGSIGSVKVTLVPHAASPGTEYFKMTFNAPGEWDFTGWSLSNSEGFDYTFDVEPIAKGESITFCGALAAGITCDYVWGGIDDFPDTDGDYTLTDFDGNVVSTKTYTAPGAGGTSVTDAPDIITTIFDTNAQVAYCRASKQGYSAHQANVSNIVGQKGQLSADSGSIIPSFYYSEGVGVKYYPGLAWPDTTGAYANGCN